MVRVDSLKIPSSFTIDNTLSQTIQDTFKLQELRDQQIVPIRAHIEGNYVFIVTKSLNWQ